MPGAVAVPDASVLLKWVLKSDDEEDGDRAAALKEAWLSGACDLAVPSLWIYEVGNVLGLKRPASARALLQAMLDMELEEHRPAQYLDEIYQLVARHKVTFYDAAYHGLAIYLKGTLITADAVYVKKTAQSGHATLLTDWT